MFTLLAEQQKKHLYHRYRLRLFSFINFFLSALLLIAALLLSPSLYLLKIEKAALKSEKDMYEKSVMTGESKGLLPRLVDINTMVSLATPAETKLFIALGAVLGRRPAGVAITSMSYTRGEGAPSSLTLQGVAGSRASLIEFYKLLQKEKQFTSSALPVESLVKETNTPFTINLQGKF
jgi:hypothetical protein